MKTSIEREDFERLVAIFADHPDFRTEDRRWRLIDEAFFGVERGSAATGGLDLRDPPRNAAVGLVRRLLEFSCLGDRHSLALVLDVLRASGGDDRSHELDRLISILDAGCGSPAPGNESPGRTANILHLSDLHFGTLANAHNFHSQLAEDLKGELGCSRLDGLICSGDLTMVCSDPEYLAAVAFIDKLKDELGLTPDRIILVPGNHDLGWSLSEAAYDSGDIAAHETASAEERRRWIVAGGRYQVRDEDRYRQPLRPPPHPSLPGHPRGTAPRVQLPRSRQAPAA
jgi:hypothetical protein